MIIMPQLENLGEWIKSRYGDQGGLAAKLKPPVAKNTVSSWKTGRNGIPPEYKKQMRALGFSGPWPQEEAQGPATDVTPSGITREEFAEERGALRAEIRLLREALEKMGEGVRELAIQVRELRDGK
jgi:hypothetical protein